MHRVYQGKYYDVNEEGIESPFPFLMEVTCDDKLNFSGTVWDEEFSSITGLKSSVKGYINEDHISFVKQYPCLYSWDETGKVVIDNSKSGHQVIYNGYWNNSEGKWIGEWEVEGETEVFTNEMIKTQVYLGKFEMRMV